eukprot:353857-Chlamydomonas_euryale.AAC.11
MGMVGAVQGVGQGRDEGAGESGDRPQTSTSASEGLCPAMLLQCTGRGSACGGMPAHARAPVHTHT